MTDLIQRLAEGSGSRALSDEVLLAVGAKRSIIGHFHGPMYAWRLGEKTYTEPNYPDPSQSADDALALAGQVMVDHPSWHLFSSLGQDFAHGQHAKAEITWPSYERQGFAIGKNPLPRAICIAVLKCKNHD